MSDLLINRFSELFAQVTSVDQLREIADLYKQTNDRLQFMSVAKFRKGQTVKFEDRRGAMIQGIIVKVNPKTVQVKTSVGTWRISPSLLSVA
jgi:hypothetical protein